MKTAFFILIIICLLTVSAIIKPWWLVIDKDLRIGNTYVEALDWQVWRWKVKWRTRA